MAVWKAQVQLSQKEKEQVRRLEAAGQGGYAGLSHYHFCSSLAMCVSSILLLYVVIHVRLVQEGKGV
jgi:hypothetical protein